MAEAVFDFSAETSEPITTFYGPDGCGKSTIAQEVASLLAQGTGDTLLIGSSEFKEWITADIYTTYIGSTDRLEDGTKPGASPDAKTSLYEDLAVCLYGLAGRHAANDGPVIIHSDPYLKRLAWKRKTSGDDEFWAYADWFDSYITERIGGMFASHAAIVRTTAHESFDRILNRGPVSEYDPVTAEENDILNAAVNFIGDWFLGDARPYPRLDGTKVISIANPTDRTGSLDHSIRRIATTITGFVRSN